MPVGKMLAGWRGRRCGFVGCGFVGFGKQGKPAGEACCCRCDRLAVHEGGVPTTASGSQDEVERSAEDVRVGPSKGCSRMVVTPVGWM